MPTTFRRRLPEAGGLFTLLFGLAMAPGPAHGETLLEALAAAYARNPAIQAERARQRAQDEAVPQAMSGWLPKVTLDGHTGRERTHPRPGEPSHLGPDSLSVGLSQPLFSGLRTINAKRKAEATVRAGQEELFRVTQTVLLEVADAFVAVRRDRAIARLRAENVSFLRSEQKSTEARRKEGELSRTDVAQARARLQEGLAALAQAEADRDSSEAVYASLVGHPPGPLAPPAAIDELLPADLGEAVVVAESENPAIRSARHRKSAAGYEIKEARGDALPTVSLDLKYGREFDSSSFRDTEDEKSVFLRMSVPLYQGGAVSSRVRAARQSFVKRNYEVSDTLSRTRAEVHTSWQQWQAAKRRIRAANLQVEAAREALKGVKIEADVGERALFEVLDAQRELVNGRVGLERAKGDVITGSYRLLAALGRFTVDHLRLATPVYDPAANLRFRRFSPFGGIGKRIAHEVGGTQGVAPLRLAPMEPEIAAGGGWAPVSGARD